jgi:predicted phage terminase large subunit-like protein
VLRLPALAESQPERDDANKRLGLPLGARDPLGREPGEPLCPQRFSKAALEQLRRDVGAGGWHAQYQGVPRPAEGHRFKRSWFPVIDWPPPPDQMPQNLARVRYWDKAGSTGNNACYTVGLLMARTPEFWVVEDVVRGRWSSGERNAIMLATAQRDADRYGESPSIWCEQEPGSGGKESAEATVRLLAGFPIRCETVTGSKEVRAEPFAAQAEAGNVRVARAPWNGDYIDEVLSFPTGRFSDQVDASSGAFNHLARRSAVLDDEDMPLAFAARGSAPTRYGDRDRSGVYEGRTGF